MSFLLDTDICSAYLKGDHRVFNRFMQHSGSLHLSVVSLGELYTWVLRAKSSPPRLAALEALLADVVILDATREVARKFGEVRAFLLDAGLPPPDMDLLIAATAIVHDLTLVTHNHADYANVPNLRVVDWLAS